MVASPQRRSRAQTELFAARVGSNSAADRKTRGSRDLDSLIHHRLRLGILSALAGTDSLTFNELKALLGTTDGNLSVHARKLEEASYVACSKSFQDRRPLTRYRLSPEGRRALQRYVDHIEALVRATRKSLEK